MSLTIENQEHPKWGKPLGKQVDVPTTHEVYGTDGEGYEMREVPRFWAFLGGPPTKWKSVYVGMINQPVNDMTEVERTFKYRTGLRRITFGPSMDCGSEFLLEFDSLPGMIFQSDAIELKIHPNRAAQYDGRATVDVEFFGTGPRNGPLVDFEGSLATCYFASQEQLEQMLEFDGTMPVKITAVASGRCYIHKGGGIYEWGNGEDRLTTMAVLWLLLNREEREDFALNHLQFQTSFDIDGQFKPEYAEGEDDRTGEY